MTPQRGTQSEEAANSDSEDGSLNLSTDSRERGDTQKLAARLRQTRDLSQKLAEPLSPEDQTVQAMDDASPTKWHLAHTTWFFEEFILKDFLPDYKCLSPDYNYCFNSYYEAKGDRHPRASRGLLTRPSSDEVEQYRGHVDEALARLFDLGIPDETSSVADLVELGINHEQQHQELILTDILSLFARSPLYPAYRKSSATDCDGAETSAEAGRAENWIEYEGGIHEIGYTGDGFHYDNERPAHEVLLRPFKLRDHVVRNTEWVEFVGDGGYQNPNLWLADGWAFINQNDWSCPQYWQKRDGLWWQMTLGGNLPLEPAAPVTHINYYEADAFARWAGKRLPTEYEWEVASRHLPIEGNFLDRDVLKPRPVESTPTGELKQMFGDVWEWTSSPYNAYPGYRAPKGAVGEYNGKFMCSQFTLKGGSCVTPPGHIRRTYRNFFYPNQNWQFTGLRLADDFS